MIDQYTDTGMVDSYYVVHWYRFKNVIHGKETEPCWECAINYVSDSLDRANWFKEKVLENFEKWGDNFKEANKVEVYRLSEIRDDDKLFNAFSRWVINHVK